MGYESTIRRDREVRDVFNKLRAKYRNDCVLDFISRNYFMTNMTVYNSVQRVDKLPVTEPSIIYKTVMSDDFKL